jgi:hypothetical protein
MRKALRYIRIGCYLPSRAAPVGIRIEHSCHDRVPLPMRAGLSAHRCKWPDTLSYGLARRGRHDRETVGHESAGTSRPRPIASAMAPVGTSRSVAVRPSARPTTPEGVTSGRSVPAGSPRRLNPPAIGEGESEHCRAPPRMHLGALGDLRLPQSPGSCFQRSVEVRRAPDAGNVRGSQRSRGTRGQGTVSHREFWNEYGRRLWR